MKKFLITFFTAIIATTSWASKFEVDGIYYEITSSTNMTVEVTFEKEYNGTSSGHKTIPSNAVVVRDYYDDYNECYIFDYYISNYGGSITIPSSVTYNGNTYTVTRIGDYAFGGSTNLKSVSFPSSVTSIGESAFQNCTNLNYVTIPSKVTKLNNKTFKGCSTLNSIDLSSVTQLGYNVFENCTSLGTITLPSSLTDMGCYTFSGCTNLWYVNPSFTLLTFFKNFQSENMHVKSMKIVKCNVEHRKLKFSLYLCTHELHIAEKI